MNRRKFMTSAAATAGAAGAVPVMSGHAHADPRSLPSLRDVDRSVANLENAYWGVMPRSVEEEYAKQTRWLNRHNVTFVRDGIPGHERTVAMDNVRADVARLMGAPKEEFAADPHPGRHGTPRSGHQLSASCDEGLRAGAEDGDATAQEAPCSHGRAHRYRTGQRCPGDPTLYNTRQELDRLVTALRRESGAFL
ncbi:twin-arginine translocation signal domain-containing protein [Streptomyces sp. CA-100214]